MYTRSGNPVGLIDRQVIPSAEPKSSVVGDPSPGPRADSATIPAGPAATLTRLAPSSPAKSAGRAAQVNNAAAVLVGLGGGDDAVGSVAVGVTTPGDAGAGETTGGAHPSSVVAPSRNPAARAPPRG
jgi:hypothetical protein